MIILFWLCWLCPIFIKQSKCMTEALFSISDPILDISAGNYHLSILHGTLDISMKYLSIYNTSSNTLVTVGTFFGNYSQITELRGENNLSYNRYSIYSSSYYEGVKILQNNFDFLVSETNGARSGVLTNDHISYFYQDQYQVVPPDYNQKIKNPTSVSNRYSQAIQPKGSQFLANDFVFSYLLSYNQTTAKIRILNATSNYSLIKTDLFNRNTMASNFFGATFDPYYCYAWGDQIRIFHKSNLSQVCSLTISEIIFDAKITDKFIYISTQTRILQYLVHSCQHVQQEAISQSFRMQIIYQLPGSIYIWSPGSNTLNKFAFSDPIMQAVVCDYTCLTCSENGSYCKTCIVNMEMTVEGKCQLPAVASTIISSTNIVSTFRQGSINYIFIIVEKLDLFSHHKTKYDGTIKAILDQINQLNDFKWTLLPIDFLMRLTNDLYDTSSYNNFTNQNFYKNERTNSLIYESAKKYFMIYIPGNLVLFFILNRIFFCIRKYKISTLLRVYSFIFYYFVITVFSNITTLSFLFAQYFQLLFSFNLTFKIGHLFSLVIIGFLIIGTFSMFFMNQYFHEKLSHYFLINAYKSKYSLSYHFLRYCLRPFIQAAITVFLFQQPKVQLILLGFFQLTFVAVIILYDIKYSIFKSKFNAYCDIFIGFFMVILYWFLTLKHMIFSQQPIIDILQQSIQILFLLLAFAAALIIIRQIFSLLAICFTSKQYNADLKVKDGKNVDKAPQIEQQKQNQNKQMIIKAQRCKLNLKIKTNNNGLNSTSKTIKIPTMLLESRNSGHFSGESRKSQRQLSIRLDKSNSKIWKIIPQKKPLQLKQNKSIFEIQL